MRSRSLCKAACAAWAASLAACTFNPINGQTFGGNITNKVLTFDGFTDVPNAPVRVQVLEPANQDPYAANSFWRTLANGVSANVAYHHNDPDPLYRFSLSATPVTAGFESRWQQGGLGRFRVQYQKAGTWYNTTTFDDATCIVEHFDESWKAIGSACASHDNTVLTMVSTSPLPPNGLPYLSKRGNASKETSAYYAGIGAPLGAKRRTLGGWKDVNHFDEPFAPGSSATATYYNNADLGIGREMHCRSNLSSAPPFNVQSVACYVSNYGDATDGDTSDKTDALNQAIARQHPFATVAMEWYPGGAPNDTRFFVFDDAGALINSAALDTEGAKPVPGLCLSCHGGAYNPGDKKVTGAKFLPFDLDNFAYSTAAGWTREDQQEQFRKLNAIVALTSPTPAIADLLGGWYGGALNVANTPFDGTFVPAGWSTEPEVYTRVVARYCRMCHMANTGPLAFGSFADFNLFAPSIELDACTDHVMPHAEIPRKAFWTTNARAHLFGGALGRYPHCN